MHTVCSDLVSPVGWGSTVHQPTHQLAVPEHCSRALAHWGFCIAEQEPVASCQLPLKELVVAFVAVIADVQHHPPKPVQAAPLVLESTLGAELCHAQLHRVLQAGSGLHRTSLDPLHDHKNSLELTALLTICQNLR